MNRPGGRRLRSAAVALAGLALLAVPPGSSHRAAADVAPATPPAGAGTYSDPALPVRISVSVLEPAAPHPGDALRLEGRLLNSGAGDLTDVRMRLRVSSSPVTTRNALAEAASQTGLFGHAVSSTEIRLPAALAPGASVPFRLVAPVDSLGISESGVYPFGIEVRGRDSSGELATAGRLRTFLPLTAAVAGFTPTRLAWLWPLAAPPVRGPSGDFPDERLAAELGPAGRLTALVGAVNEFRRPAGVPVTVVVDPALLEAAQAMTAGYRVRPPGRGAPAPGTGQSVAAAWLAAVRAATQASTVLSLPYADPDVVALVRAGLGDDVSHTVQTGREITRRLLPNAANATRVGWPPAGLLTQSALDTLSGAGIDTVVVSGAALPVTRELTYTPDARAVVQTVGGTVRALVTDDTLDRLVASGAGDLRRNPAAAGSARLDEQRFLAETLLITLEHPHDPRTVVVAPPRQWHPAPSYARGVLADTGRVPWLKALTIPEAAAGSGAATPHGPLTYPVGAAAAELPPSYLGRPTAPVDGSVGSSVAGLRSGLREFEAILVGTDDTTVALDLAVFRLESAAWRDDPRQARRLRATVRAALLGRKNKVRIGTAGLVTLTSRSGTIPVTVVNGLSQPVRLQLVLSSNSARVTTRSPGVQTIDAGHSVQVSVQTTRAVRTSGVFPVSAQLLTPEGRPYSPAVKLLVRSTAYGVVALGITGGALGVLMFALAVRLVRRAWRAGRRPSNPPRTPS